LRVSYEAFEVTEELLIGEAGRWDVPTVVIAESYLIGESAITQGLVPQLECVFGAGGNLWPVVSALEAITVSTGTEYGNPLAEVGGEPGCLLDEEASAICAAPEPLFVLYFAEPLCQDHCSRTRYDLRYLQGVYPQLVVDERDLSENRALAEAVGERLRLGEHVRSKPPVIIVGDDYLAGEGITLTALREILAHYADGGATTFWYAMD
jgi:hypothetical protein